MGVSGNFSALRRLQSVVKDLGDGERSKALTRVAQRMSVTALKLVADEFRNEKDPYDVPWEELKSRRGQILSDTTRMKHSVAGQAAGTTVRITIGAKYAIFHQAGTRAHPRAARTIPVNRRGRFISKARAGKAKRSVGVVFSPAHVHGGLPRRQMLPEVATGGLGTTWENALSKDADDIIRDVLERAGEG